MNMDADTFIQKIEDEGIEQKNQSMTNNKFKNNFEDIFKVGSDFIAEQLSTGKLAQFNLDISDIQVQFHLETNLINLPLRYNKEISKIISNDGEMPINVYLIIEHPNLNRSNLRIDELNTADEFITHSDEMNAKINEWVQDKLTTIQSNQKEAKEAEKASSKKTKTTKTTSKTKGRASTKSKKSKK